MGWMPKLDNAKRGRERGSAHISLAIYWHTINTIWHWEVKSPEDCSVSGRKLLCVVLHVGDGCIARLGTFLSCLSGIVRFLPACQTIQILFKI